MKPLKATKHAKNIKLNQVKSLIKEKELSEQTEKIMNSFYHIHGHIEGTRC